MAHESNTVSVLEDPPWEVYTLIDSVQWSTVYITCGCLTLQVGRSSWPLGTFVQLSGAFLLIQLIVHETEIKWRPESELLFICSGSEESWDRHPAEEDRWGAEPGRADAIPEKIHWALQPRWVPPQHPVSGFVPKKPFTWPSPITDEDHCTSGTNNLCSSFFCLAVSATHKETKQFFTLYNTLDDKKVYLEKEVSLSLDIVEMTQICILTVNEPEMFSRLIYWIPSMTTSNSEYKYIHLFNVYKMKQIH